MAPLIAWSASTLVEEVCDDQFQCQWTVVDRATGDARLVGVPPAGAVVRVGELSSDLARLAYLVIGPGSAGPSLEVLDLMTGQRTMLDDGAMLPSYRNATGLVWSADGQWLFWLRPRARCGAGRSAPPGRSPSTGRAHHVTPDHRSPPDPPPRPPS